jgi:protein-L-isoaspartate O-methyltransferase
MTDVTTLQRRLVDDLIAVGKLTPPWLEAFAAVPRHQFIPDTIWDDSSGELVPLRRDDDPDRWWEAAYAPAVVVTQVDDGHPAGPDQRGHYITSSASQPDVVALMFDALDVQPGMRVLEIGTGTGYNAALLAHRLGSGNVTSVEIDPEVADHARRALTTTGYPVTVLTGDGAQGYPPMRRMTGSSPTPQWRGCPTRGWLRRIPEG